MDKFKTCKDCPDRKLHCHSTCEGYIKRNEEAEKVRNKRANENSFAEYQREASVRMKTRRNYRRKRKW